MQRLISPEQMLNAEKNYFETSGVKSISVMEKAAMALRDAVLSRFPRAENIFIACGPGGNGGDGYACARLLQEAGKRCRIYASAPAKSPDAIENACRAAQTGIPILLEELPGEAPDLWIDCLYGTGLSREPSGRSAELIRCMANLPVLACDIPSGLNGMTGRAYDPCVQADITITFQRAKFGHFLQDGLDVCGEVQIADVGFPDSIFPENAPCLFAPGDLNSLLKPRKRNIHKGSCGHLLIVAGSVGMAGAAALCAKAALRSGAGLVSIACPAEIVPILQVHAPCAMCIPMPQDGDVMFEEGVPILKGYLRGKTAVAIGPGLTRWTAAGIVQAVLECGLPAVIDADALNIISENPGLKALLNETHVITPHPGEAARLLGYKIEDPIADARALAGLGAAAVLKGASRVIASEKACFISKSGGCGMARGGSGDILTGITGALLAEKSGRTPMQSAAAACEIHGLAGALAQQKYGAYAMNAADILEFLPEVFKQHVQ